MINTLPTWQAQHAANTLDHNEVVRAFRDAQDQIDALKANNDALRTELEKLRAELREERGYLAMERGDESQ